MVAITCTSSAFLSVSDAVVSSNSTVLFLGKRADVHAVCFENIVNNDPSTAALNLSIDYHVSGNLLKDYYAQWTDTIHTNSLLDKLDADYDLIVLIPRAQYLYDTPELSLEAARLVQQYTASMGTEVVMTMIWDDTSGLEHTAIFEGHQYRIADALGMGCIPAGLTWKRVREDATLSVGESSATDNTTTDHAEAALALSVYSHLFEQSAVNSSYVHGTVSVDEWSKIVDHAYQAWSAALVASHYTGAYTKGFCSPWTRPHDMGNRRWATMGTSTESGVFGQLRELSWMLGYSERWSPPAGKWWTGEYFPNILNDTEVQEAVIAENYDFIFGRMLGKDNSVEHMDTLHGYDPDAGGDTRYIDFARHWSNDLQKSIRTIYANQREVAASASGVDGLYAIPNYIAFGRAVHERPDLVLIPADNIHLTSLGLLLQAGQIYSLATGQNAALGSDAWTEDQKYVLNLAYQTVIELGGLKHIDLSGPSAVGVQIDGTLGAGQTLNGLYRYVDADGDLEGTSTYRWILSADEIPSADDAVVGTSQNYAVQAGDLGQVLYFEVTPVDASNTVGEAVLSAPLYNSPPTATGVSISGEAMEGSLLSGSYTYTDPESDAEGATTFRWLRSTDIYLDSGDSVITNTQVYTVQAADIGSYLFFEVTPVALTGGAGGLTGVAAAAPETAPVVPGTIFYSITSSAGANGSIDPSGLTSVAEGADQAYVITADEGYAVEDVLVDSVSVGAVSNYTFSAVATNHTIEAFFYGLPVPGDPVSIIVTNAIGDHPQMFYRLIVE